MASIEACEMSCDDLALFMIEYGAIISEEAFHLANRKGHSAVVDEMMTQSSQARHWALLDACKTGNGELAKTLINTGVDVNKADVHEDIPLLAAYDRSNVEIVKLLIDVGADVTKSDKFGRVILIAACEKEDIEVVKLLIKAKADVNKKDDHFGRFPLLAACVGKDSEIVELLINAGADVNQEGPDGRFPLAIALEQILDDNIFVQLRLRGMCLTAVRIKACCLGQSVSASLQSMNTYQAQNYAKLI
ncbi:putative ankyrin repeat protein RF_0950 [Oscarella lobularis]|uniref:putative ankyrin repeat protein RF_0950 n=1 Tax=Oscarella lobularis TaxID=121494 RepID=UPI0033132C54